MLPTWIIEAGVYGAEAEPLLAEVRRQGMAALLVSFPSLARGPALLPDGACALGYGTFPFARQIQLHHRWLPGAWCNPDRLDCAAYYPQFGPFLLNRPHALLTGTEVLARRDELFDTLGIEDELFVRPAGCDKLFTGRVVYRDDFAAALAPARYDPATRVVVAPPRTIDREWRLVVTGDAVVAASQYARDGLRDVVPGAPAEVRAFVEGMLARVAWRPDPLFMLDVGAAEGRLHLIELNGFSTSWLYGCDLPAVVDAASKLARQAPGPGGEP